MEFCQADFPLTSVHYLCHISLKDNNNRFSYPPAQGTISAWNSEIVHVTLGESHGDQGLSLLLVRKAVKLR